jgi:hypothetical protein
MTIKSQPLDFAVSIIAVAGHWVRIWDTQEVCKYPYLLRHSSSFIERFARTLLAGCVKAINLFLRGNPSRGVSAPIVDRKRFRCGDDGHFSVQGLC